MNKQYFYAELNEDNVCKAVSALSGIVDAPHMIQIEEYDESLLGKKYEDGQWIEFVYPIESNIE